MSNLALRELWHRQIIIDLTIRTLQRDLNYISSLKTSRVYELWIHTQTKELHEELKKIKQHLSRHDSRLLSEKQNKETNFTEYQFLEKGNLQTLNYSNIALRNWVDEELKRLFNLEYRKPQ